MATNDVYLRPDAGDGTNGVRLRTDAADGGGAYTLTALNGTYAVTGQSATLLRSKLITASNGTYAVTGQSVTLLRSKLISASNGSYTISGQNATLLKSRLIVSSNGTYSVTGQSATLLRTKLLEAISGNYTLTGQSATLLRSKLVISSFGSYFLSGENADITYAGTAANYQIDAGFGVYTVTGQSAYIVYTAAIAGQTPAGGSSNSNNRNKRRIFAEHQGNNYEFSDEQQAIEFIDALRSKVAQKIQSKRFVIRNSGANTPELQKFEPIKLKVESKLLREHVSSANDTLKLMYKAQLRLMEMDDEETLICLL